MSDASSDPQSQQLNQIIADYRRAVESGNAPDREVLFEQHAELAADLKSFFVNYDKMQAVREAIVAPTLAPQPVASNAATVPPDSRTVTAPEVGAKVRYFGDYELLNEIARGGMGVVYRARQVSLNRVVALKMILAGQLAGEEDVQRFHAEAEAAANLDHPGIVPIFEVGEHEGQHYFSMGFVEGDSLANKIKDGPLPPREAAGYTKKVAEAMAYAHERGVIHRDLKPANVLLDENDEPKVTDFGLAKRVERESDLTATGQILGTPSYMPPEQASGKIDQITETADVYSLGAVLYALVTGRPPFQAASHLDTLMQVLEQEPLSPRQLNPKVPQDLETICLKCLEKEQPRRYSSAAEMADELQRFLNSEPIRARPISAPTRAWRWCKRKPAIATLAVTSVLLLVTVAGVALAGYLREAELRKIAQQAEAKEKTARRETEAERDGALDRLARSLFQEARATRMSGNWNDGGRHLNYWERRKNYVAANESRRRSTPEGGDHRPSSRLGWNCVTRRSPPCW